MRRNDYTAIIRDLLPGIIEELEEQGMLRPSLRSCYYLLLDRGHLLGGSKDYQALNRRLSSMRDAGDFSYGLLDGEAGTSRRGKTPEELADYLRRVEEDNVLPELVDGRLVAVMVEKAGLVDYLRKAVGWRLPVGSAGGQLRKEWAHRWIEDLLDLSIDLNGGELHIVYLGDCDRWGAHIKETTKAWIESLGVTLKVYACQPGQLQQLNEERGLHLEELHIDGYISLVGPRQFAQELRRYIGLDSRRGET